MTMREEKYKLLNELQLRRRRYEERAEYTETSFNKAYYAGIAHGFELSIKLAEEMREEGE